MKELFNELHRIILINGIDEKCAATHSLAVNLKNYNADHTLPVLEIPLPGYPPTLRLVAPRQLKRRGIKTQSGRNTLLHAVAHIEFSALNLALDAAYRFRDQPAKFYQDWIHVADEEAKHFNLIREYLNIHGCEYGDLSAHNGLWEMAVQTADDIVARMALVPRVMEARGLDVTPAMIDRLRSVGDLAATDILQVIYQDEIGHVAIGSHWFFYQCKIRQLEPRPTFLRMVETHLHGELRGPFNISARLQAGFDEMEMAYLSEHY